MKSLKKMIALTVALMMVLPMGAKVFAEGEGGETPSAEKHSINLEGGKKGHTYTLYQIFTGKVEDGELTNIQWGADAPQELKDAYPTAAAAAKELSESGDARAFAQQWSDKLTGGTELTLDTDGNVTFSDLDEGYYIIKDTVKEGAQVSEEDDYYSAFVVKLVEDVEGKMKGSGPTSEKKVENKEGTKQDAADYNIGDDVPFELKATTADNVSSYKKYHITFQDTQSEGLDDPTEFRITVLGQTVTLAADAAEPVVVETDKTKITIEKVAVEGKTFAIKVTFEPKDPNEQYLDEECNLKDILVDYTSKLNDDAAIGEEGNLNEFNIKYSNNPESDDDSEEGETPDDKVKVFTYEPIIKKTDEEGNPLKGAAFTIYQEVTADTEGAQTGAAIKEALGDKIEASALADDKYYVAKVMTVLEDGSTFDFKGLSDGTYVLVETQIPAGYNAFKSVEFTISSTYETESPDPQLLTLTGTDPFTESDLEHGTLTAEIENKSGSELPETGGMGTTLFYLFGGMMVLGAGILLVSRKRMAE